MRHSGMLGLVVQLCPIHKWPWTRGGLFPEKAPILDDRESEDVVTMCHPSYVYGSNRTA